MDNEAIEIVTNYIKEQYPEPHDVPDFVVFTVWKCKTLQNWKYTLSTNMGDNVYYELTYNGDLEEWYLDVYKKRENRRIKRLKK